MRSHHGPLGDVLPTDLHLRPGTCLLRLRGELDGPACPALTAALDRALDASGPGLLLVDLRRVTFCDLDGLRALEAARRRAVRGGGDPRCRGLSPLLRRVARVVGFDELVAATT